MNLMIAGYEADNLTAVQREAAAYADFYGSGIALPTTGRRGTKCLKLRGGQTVDYALPTTSLEFFIGLAFYTADNADTGTTKFFLKLYDSGNSGNWIQAYVNDGRRLALSCSASSPISWAGLTAIAAGGWYHIGLHLKGHLSTGALSGYLGGSPTADNTETTGKTINSGVSLLDTLRLSGPGTTNSASSYHQFGDIYVNDATNGDGLGDNALWGDYKITGRKLLANGANTGLTRSSGTDDAALLGDDSDSTYLYGTAGKTTCTVNALGFTANNIKTRAVKMVADKEDATTRTLDCTTRVSGADYDGGSVKSLQAATKRRYVFLQPVNPATSARWAQAALEASQVGPKIA